MPFAIALYALLAASAGALAGRSLTRRVLSLALAAASLAVPFLVAGPLWLRALLALGSVLAIFRAVDLARDPDHRLPMRVGLMFAILDLRQVRSAPAVFDLRRAALGLGYTAASVACLWIALRVAALPWRWLSGVAAVYLSAEGANCFMLFGWRSAGFRVPKQHDAPIVATSVTEFWSRRWNINVRDWLFRNCHRPLARRGHPTAGILAAFAASALLHYWFIFVALGHLWAAVMASFFVLQALFMLAESRLRPREWSPAARRAWTICLVVGSSPLFVEPFLRLFA